MTVFSPGDMVDHVGIRSEPGYAALHRNGEVVKVTSNRVHVRWPNLRPTRYCRNVKMYMPSQLRLSSQEEPK
jgi:hypothetical protein